MKILYFDDFKLGVLVDGDVVDITDVVEDIPHLERQDIMAGLIANFDTYRTAIEKHVANSAGVPYDSVRIRPPLPKPANIECMAVNYMEDGTRDEPAPINGFHKSPSCLIGHGDMMVLEDIPASIFEGEAELALIIGKRASHVKAEDAMDYIFGYTNFIDGSARGLQKPGSNMFYQMKSRETYAPVGPYIVTADEIDDPQNLAINLTVNGDVMQSFNSNDMAHNIPRCIEWVSSIHTMEPGDILATGTNHRGLNAFQDGDVVELECEGMGKLQINIRDDLKRTWSRETRLMRQEKDLPLPNPQLTGKYAQP